MPLLVLAYAVLFLPAGGRARCGAAVAQAPPVLEEVARSLGRRPLRRAARRSPLPLAAPGHRRGRGPGLPDLHEGAAGDAAAAPDRRATRWPPSCGRRPGRGAYAAAAPYAAVLRAAGRRARPVLLGRSGRRGAPAWWPELRDDRARGARADTRASARPTCCAGLDLRRRRAARWRRCSGRPAAARRRCCGCIAGFEPADAGTVRIGGRVVAGAGGARAAGAPPDRRSSRRRARSSRTCTVAGNVGVRAGPRPARRARPGRARCWSWSGWPATAKRMPHELSGGQQQRVALARALAPGPRAGAARRAVQRARRRPARRAAAPTCGPRCARPARPRCWSRTTSRRRCRWPTGWR